MGIWDHGIILAAVYLLIIVSITLIPVTIICVELVGNTRKVDIMGNHHCNDHTTQHVERAFQSWHLVGSHLIGPHPSKRRPFCLAALRRLLSSGNWFMDIQSWTFWQKTAQLYQPGCKVLGATYHGSFLKVIISNVMIIMKKVLGHPLPRKGSLWSCDA